MSISRRIWNLLLEFLRIRRTPFVLHEAYPEIVFWEVGQQVKIEGTETVHEELVTTTTSAVVQDFDKNGKFIFRIKGSDSYSFRDFLSEQTYTLQFVERISPSTIRAKGAIRRNGQNRKMNVSGIFNPHIRGKGSYMELLRSIKEVIGMQDWEEPKKLGS